MLWQFIAWSAAGATLTASLDHTTLVVGERAQLSLVFEGGSPSHVPSFPALPNLSIDYLGQSSQFSFSNGRTSSSLSHRYQITAAQPGDYVIPSISVKVDGQTLSTQPLKLNVIASTAQAQAQNTEQLAFIKLLVPKTEVYLGEILPVEIQVYVRNGQGQDLQRPQLKAEGFTLGKIPEAAQSRTLIGNLVYDLVTFRLSATAAKTGKLQLGPVECSLALRIPVAKRRRRDPFDPLPIDPFDFFGNPYELRRVTLSSEPQTIHIAPLPAQNAPVDFSGAVGSFSLKVSASRTNLSVGDPITLTIQIAGAGALDNLQLPAINQWRGFKSYPPNTKIEPRDELGLSGIKTIEQVIVPENPEVKEIPGQSLSFFDPEQRAYRRVQHSPIPLAVHPSAAAPAQPTVLAGPASAESRAPAKDIVHIKTRPGLVAQITPPLIQRPWFVALHGLPLAAWISAIIWRRRQDHLAKNPRLRRRREVSRLIRSRLRQLEHEAAANEAEKFFATLFRVLQEQLGERLDLPASSITEAVVEEHLRPRGVPQETLAQLHELFQACNQARYAPETHGHPLTALAPKVKSVVQQLQKFQPRLNRAVLFLAAVFLTVVSLIGGAAQDFASAFDQANRLYEQGQHRQAADAYQELIASGKVSAELYFNCGNALLKSGQIGRAIAAYRTAERLTPRDPDLRANLKFARESVQRGSSIRMSKLRHWIGRLTLNEWSLLWVGAFWGWFGLLIARQLRHAWKSTLRSYSTTAGLLMLLPALGLAYSLDQHLAGKTAIVIVPEANVRYGPLEESASFYPVTDGAELAVLDRKGDWLQVTDASKRTGWIKQQQIALL